jgi:hypothetical protein
VTAPIFSILSFGVFMKITVLNPNTVFGDVLRTFDNHADALAWVGVCLSNEVKCIVEVSHA